MRCWEKVSVSDLSNYLAQGGTITQLAPAPIRKHNHVPAKAQLLVLLKRGAMHRDEILKHIDEATLNSGYRGIRASGIPITTRDGWYALDQADLPAKVMPLPKIQLTERQIAFAIGKYYLSSKHLVAVNNFYWTGYECDLLCVTHTLKPIEFEIKISRDDFFRDAHKAKWQRPIAAWKHYYILPDHIYSTDLLDRLPHSNSGILTIYHKGDSIYLRECKKAQANSVPAVTPQQLMNITRLIASRLWQGGLHA